MEAESDSSCKCRPLPKEDVSKHSAWETNLSIEEPVFHPRSRLMQCTRLLRNASRETEEYAAASKKQEMSALAYYQRLQRALCKVTKKPSKILTYVKRFRK